MFKVSIPVVNYRNVFHLSKIFGNFNGRNVVNLILEFIDKYKRVSNFVSSEELPQYLRSENLDLTFERLDSGDIIYHKFPKKKMYGHYVFVKTLTGKTYSPYVQENFTTEDLKKEILNNDNIPITNQRIILKGEELLNNEYLPMNEIRQCACIHLVLI